MYRILIFFMSIAYFFFPAYAKAYFLLPYTPETVLDKAKDMEMRIVFTSPAQAGQVLDMDGISEFYALEKHGVSDVTKIDLKETLREITWKNPNSSNKAFTAALNKKYFPHMGDYVICIIPGYAFDKEEDIYIQQFTKLIVNIGGIPGNWNEPANLPCEIVPLSKPYGLWKGNIFTAQVLSQGKPVPFAEIEVEYVSHVPDIRRNIMYRKSSVRYPNDILATQTIMADSRGYFSYGVPKAGWWGFAATGVGPDDKHEDKELSQDAVIWVQAVDMN